MNKYIKNLAIALILIIASTGFANSSEFIEGLEDIPIIDNFTQVESENVSFGNEESRLIETYISSKKATFNEVRQFYAKTLPQMGWKVLKNNSEVISFERELEVLEIVRESQKPLLVRITLKSKG